MPNWKSKLKNIFERLEGWSDGVRFRFKTFDNDILIVPYMGFGNADKIYICGRVMEDKGNRESSKTDSKWRNLKNCYKDFETDEIPNAIVRARFQEIEQVAKTDKEGYFRFEIDLKRKSPKKLWHDVEFELLEPILNKEQKTKTVGLILMPPNTATFGVISDIDDTILKTNVKNKIRMFLTTILSNAHSRVPFEGVAAFYQALQKGVAGNENNPIFYVSSSPYNLYQFLTKFLELQKIPLGPIFLKDFGTHTPFISGNHKTHKLKNIKNVLESYPHLQFVLVGDNSEQDPEIYKEIVKEYPNRIRTIYIRKVNDEFENKYDIDELIKEVEINNSQLIFAKDSEFAAKHAVKENLISADQLPNIRQNNKLDSISLSTEEI